MRHTQVISIYGHFMSGKFDPLNHWICRFERPNWMSLTSRVAEEIATNIVATNALLGSPPCAKGSGSRAIEDCQKR